MDIKTRAKEMAAFFMRQAGIEPRGGNQIGKQLEENLSEGMTPDSISFIFNPGDEKMQLREPGWEKLGDIEGYMRDHV